MKKEFTLSNGTKIPSIGFGTWLIKNKNVDKCVKIALESGYRHIDTAQVYFNEKGVGKGIKESGVAREDIFVTSKVNADIKSYKRAKKSIEKSLKRLDIGYIDLMLIHAPQPWILYDRIKYRYEKQNLAVWKALVEYYKAGKIKAIGVSNFNEHDLENIMKNSDVPPMVNQVECHIGNTPIKLIEFCHKNNIVFESYCPIGHGEALKYEIAKKMAEKYHVSIPQLCIKYTLELDTVSLPKSSSESHIKENLLLDFEIEKEDLNLLKEIVIN